MVIAMTGFHPLEINVVKMNKPFISLCPEVTRAHALTLMDWLEDERVTCYLSDSRHVSRSIEHAIDRTQLPILTHLFNQGGRFFMAYDRHDAPVGFVRLIKTGSNCEIVLAIGDSEKWGQNLGARTIREGMKLAFLDMRAKKLIAKIHPDNTRSLKAFLRSGFVLESETPTLKSFSMTVGRYLQSLREGAVGDTQGEDGGPQRPGRADETGGGEAEQRRGGGEAAADRPGLQGAQARAGRRDEEHADQHGFRLHGQQRCSAEGGEKQAQIAG